MSADGEPVEARPPEIRIDQLTGLRTILAPGRGERPGAVSTATPAESAAAASCPFCAGREDRTPPELWAERPEGSRPDGEGWRVRAVPNLYPALGAGGGQHDGAAAENSLRDPLHPATGRGDPELFAAAPAEGAHEVIVHAPEHLTAMSQLSDGQLAAAIAGWRERMRAHGGAACRHLIVNEGPGAGASLEHTHAQLYVLAFVPVEVARERERFSAHNVRTMGGCLLCDVAAEEVRRRERLVAIDDDAMVIAPWASRSAYELRVIPRTCRPRFEEDDAGVAMIGAALRLLASCIGEPSRLNLWVRTAPRDAEHFHWHLDIRPRLTASAGFELGTGVDICVQPPERAAAELRELE